MNSSLRLWLTRALVLTQLIHGALCWGKEGHYTVCKIAEVMPRRWLLCGSLLLKAITFIGSQMFVSANKKKRRYLLLISDSDNNIFSNALKSYFEEETVAAVKKLLPESAQGDLASVCSWPDEIKHHWQWRWTSPLHYVDTPDYRCNYEYCRRFILPP